MKTHFLTVGETVPGSLQKNKFQIAVGGSHGKTVISEMIIHVLRANNIEFNYLIKSVNDAEIFLYHPHIAIITGIANDQENSAPDYESRCREFKIFVSGIEPGGTLFYFDGDEGAKITANSCNSEIKSVPYKEHGWFTNKVGTFAVTVNRTVKVNFSGELKMQCLSAAKEACLAAGIDEDAFYNAISSFK